MRFLWENHREIIRDCMNIDMSFRSRRLPSFLFKLIPMLTALIYTIPASELFTTPLAVGGGGVEGLGRRFGMAVSGVALGPAIAMLLAFFLKTAGRWLGGKGGWNQLRVVIAWAQIPHLLTWLLGFGIMYGRMNTYDFSEKIFTVLWYLFYLVPLPATILTVVYSIVGVSEAHQLDLGRSFATIMIANFFLVIAGAFLTAGLFLFGLPFMIQ